MKPVAAEPTRLTRGLIAALDRPPPDALSASPSLTAVTAFLTAGLWPAWSLPHKMRVVQRWRHHVLSFLIDWAKFEVDPDTAMQIARAAASRGDRWMLRLAVWSAWIAIVSAFYVVLISPVGAGRLWFVDPFHSGPYSPALAIFLGGVGLSSVLTWLAANFHLRRGERLLTLLGKPPRRAVWEWGLRPIPVLVGGLMAWWGMTWALPLLVAASAQSRVVRQHDRRLLAALSKRVCDRTVERQPEGWVRMPEPRDRIMRCRHADCQGVLPEDASFCPQCGRRQRRSMAAYGE